MNRTTLLTLLGLAVGGFLLWTLASEILGDPATDEDSYYGDLEDTGDGEASLEARGDGGRAAREAAAAEEARKKAEEAARRGQVKPEEGVSGTVTDGGGTPIDKARISVMLAPANRYYRATKMPAVIASTLSDENGTFLVGPAPEGKRLLLRAEAAGFAPTQMLVSLRGARINLTLDRGGRLNVRVLGFDSKPIAGAKVMHAIGWGWQRVITEGASGEDGIARFSGLPTGSGNLVVAATGHAAVQQDNVAVAPGKVEERTIILEDAQQISGKVVDNETEELIQGASVQVHYPQMAIVEPSKTTSTDADGRFTVTVDVAKGQQYELRVNHSEYAAARVARNLNLQDEIVVKLAEAGEAIVGDVDGPDGRPVSGAVVTYMGLQGDDIPETKTNEFGRFELRRPPWTIGGANLMAISRQHGVATRYVRLNQKPLGEIRMRLPGGGAIEGTITGKDGAGVQGATVTVVVDPKATHEMLGSGQNPWQVMNLINQGGDRVNLSAVTDANGYYLIKGVPAMAYRVSAAYEHLQARTEEAVLVSAEVTATADITLQPGDTIEGYVYDGEDRPVPGAYVYATPADRRARGWGISQPNARSQSDGKFILRGIEDWDYTINVSASGYGASSEKNIRKGTNDLTLHLQKLGKIKGVVLDERGSPYRGTFRIHVKRLQDNSSGRSNRWWGGNDTQIFNTDDGIFEVKGKNAGKYEVRASTSDGRISAQKDTVEVFNGRDTREVRLGLLMGAVLKGRVTDDATGKAIKNAYVYVQAKQGSAGQDNSGATSGNSRSNAKGEYEIKGLGAGSYQVNVWYGGSTWGSATDIGPGEVKTVNLAKKQPGSVQVIVRDTNGQAIEGAYPYVRSESGRQIHPNWQLMRKEKLIGTGPNGWNEATRTDGNGVNVRYHIPPGRYQITASKNGYTVEGEGPWVEIVGGGESTAEVTLKKK